MIQLVPLDNTFIPYLIRWKKDEELAYLIMAKTSNNTENDVENWIKKNQSDTNQRIWGIYAKDLQKPIGIARLMFIDWEAKVTELGIYIAEKDAKGKGYGTQVVKQLLLNAFHQLGLNKVFLKVLGSNLDALHIYKKLNFTTEGTLKNHHFAKNHLHDIVFMSIFKNEFELQ